MLLVKDIWSCPSVVLSLSTVFVNVFDTLMGQMKAGSTRFIKHTKAISYLPSQATTDVKTHQSIFKSWLFQSSNHRFFEEVMGGGFAWWATPRTMSSVWTPLATSWLLARDRLLQRWPPSWWWLSQTKRPLPPSWDSIAFHCPLTRVIVRCFSVDHSRATPSLVMTLMSPQWPGDCVLAGLPQPRARAHHESEITRK